MSTKKHCDICDNPSVEINVKYKVKAGRWVWGWGCGDAWFESWDICDDCISRIKALAKEEKPNERA